MSQTKPRTTKAQLEAELSKARETLALLEEMVLAGEAREAALKRLPERARVDLVTAAKHVKSLN